MDVFKKSDYNYGCREHQQMGIENEIESQKGGELMFRRQKRSILVFFIIILLISPSLILGAKIKIKVIAEDAILRTAPDMKSAMIGVKIPVGSMYDVENRVGKWFKIKFRSRYGVEVIGYIHEMYVEVEEETPEVKREAAPKPVKPLQEKPYIKKPEEKPEKKPVPEPEPSKRRKGWLSIYLAGGAGIVEGGDLNRVVKGINRLWSQEDNYADWDEFKLMNELNAELIFNITQNIGIGIGAGYMTKKNIGSYGSEDPTFNVKYGREYTLNIIPVCASLHLSFLTRSIIGFSLHGGVGYYLGNVKHNFSYESSSTSYSRQEDVKCNTMGYYGGMSIDVNFTSHVSLVIEGSYRLAEFKDWKGTSDIAEGELYYYEYLSGYYDEYFPRIGVFSAPPSPSYYRNIRKALIDLTGFVLKGGLRINF